MLPIVPGSTGTQVSDVQRRLVGLGHPLSDEPGVYGTTTTAGIRTFQQSRGLTASGVVDDETWQRLVEAGFRLGDRLLYETRPMLTGDDVLDLQERLNRLGINAGQPDAILGPDTGGAVREFQLNVGLPTDGIVGPSTVTALQRLHRMHQSAGTVEVREREAMRRPREHSLAAHRIMVDPGHGPDHPGVINVDGVAEHQITWAIGQRLAARLGAVGVQVVLSRGPGTSPPPVQRAQLANNEQVDAIISITCSGDDSPYAAGTVSHYFANESYVSFPGRRLAELCHERVLDVTGGPDCRVHGSTSTILRASKAPSVVVAPGFLTHADEGRRLAEPKVQRLIADGLLDAVLTHLT